MECSRWKELATSMKFHAQVASLANSRTEFRFLNGSAPIIIGEGDNTRDNLPLLNTILDQVIYLFLY